MSSSENNSVKNKAIVTKFFQAMNDGDVAYIVNAYAEDGHLQTMGNTLISGTYTKEQVTASAGGIFEVFPKGLKFVALDMVADGDKVAVEATSEGEHISGQIYSNEYHFLFEFRDGKLLKLKEYMDTERVTDVLCGGQRPASNA
ncbi:MAG: ketosteroid isomerase-like protein [Halioglobus sp.]|jgi:ketosteroid isomerase-like protein